MKNDTNIYDIDGNIIRKAGDNHKFTIEEVEKWVDDLTKKVKENPDNKVYKVYLDNISKWLIYMYNNMSIDELAKRLRFTQSDVKEQKEDENERHTEDIRPLHSGESEANPEGSLEGVQE